MTSSLTMQERYALLAVYPPHLSNKELQGYKPCGSAKIRIIDKEGMPCCAHPLSAK